MEKKNGKYTLFTVMLMPASITKILFRILFYIISNTVIASFTEILRFDFEVIPPSPTGSTQSVSFTFIPRACTA